MRRATGFSLIELTVVLVVAAILSAIAIPRFGNSLARYHAQAAAQRIVADLALAQRQAKSSSAGQSVVFTTSSSSYILPGITGLNGPSSTFQVNLASDPYQSTLVSVSFGGATTITYDRFGQPNASGTIVLQCGTVQKGIVIDGNSGLASIE